MCDIRNSVESITEHIRDPPGKTRMLNVVSLLSWHHLSKEKDKDMAETFVLGTFSK